MEILSEANIASAVISDIHNKFGDAFGLETVNCIGNILLELSIRNLEAIL